MVDFEKIRYNGQNNRILRKVNCNFQMKCSKIPNTPEFSFPLWVAITYNIYLKKGIHYTGPDYLPYFRALKVNFNLNKTSSTYEYEWAAAPHFRRARKSAQVRRLRDRFGRRIKGHPLAPGDSQMQKLPPGRARERKLVYRRFSESRQTGILYNSRTVFKPFPENPA